MDTNTETKSGETPADNKENAPRVLWQTSATIVIRKDGKSFALTHHKDAYDTGRECAFRVLDWTAEREHFKSTEDEDEALLLSVRPFRELKGSNGLSYRSTIALCAVPKANDGTCDFIRDEIGATFDCVRMQASKKCAERAGLIDCWIADDFGDVAGINPLVSRLAGFRKWTPGPAVFAGTDGGGRTVSIPDWGLVANLAATWRDAVDQIAAGLDETKNPAARACLGANGLELVEFYMRETGPDTPPGFMGISIDSRTRDGAPADLLAACRREEDARANAAD